MNARIEPAAQVWTRPKVERLLRWARIEPETKEQKT